MRLFQIGTGTNLHRNGGALDQAWRVRKEIEHGVRAFSKIEESQALGWFNRTHPGDHLGAERLDRTIAVPQDQQPFGSAIQGDDTSALAFAAIQIETSFGHGATYPNPARKLIVS